MYYGDLDTLFFNLQKKYGGLYEVYNGPERVIWIGDAKLIKKIHIPSTKTNFPFRSRKPWVDEVGIKTTGKGIFFNRNLESWKYNRRILSQTVALPSFLRQFFKTTELVFEEFDGYIGNLLNVNKNEEFDLSKWIVRILSELSSRSTTGRPAYTLSSYYNRLSSKNSKKNIQWLNNYLTDLIVNRRKEIANIPKDQVLSHDILTLLICANTERGPQFNKPGDEPDEPMGDDDIKQNLYDVIIASIDSSSHTILIALYHICKCPAVKSKVYEEVDRVLGNDRSSPMKYEDLEKLTYIEACISESMRMLPTVPVIFKQANNDDNLGDFKFKGGQEFFINYHYVHHDETYWPDPESFKPERFLENKNIDKISYMPFGGGIRICPGRQMGLNSAKTLIALIFKNYTVNLVEPDAPLKKSYIWANECDELKVYLRPRNN
ncbi:517_t:CDS:2 [Racocetra fulgida]|uniref:517_t:CDS:1 n=1 Tax=Racocetra fulgida TaxID=60492 RepID=A0A9N9GBB2_9GLOM|nr:517_t:CDS:2 [Racocetra fulgida]